MSLNTEIKKIDAYLEVNNRYPARSVNEIKNAVLHSGISESVAYQVLLVLNCSSVGRRLFPEDGGTLTSAEINTMVLDAQEKTGLKESIINCIVINLFETCGIKHTFNEGPILNGENRLIIGTPKIPKDKYEEEKLEQYRREMELTVGWLRQYEDEYIQLKGKKNTDEMANNGKLIELARYGEPGAFYLLGNYYYDKAAKDKMITLDGPYMQYYQAAAKEGFPDAFVKLGDIYYGGPNSFNIFESISQIGFKNTIARMGHFNSLAFKYYSKPGAYPPDPKHREIICSIFAQKSKNIKMLFFNFITVFISFVFTFLFHTSAVEQSSHFALGLFFSIMSAAIFCLATVYNYKYQYNSLRWSVFGNGLLWALFFLSLALH